MPAPVGGVPRESGSGLNCLVWDFLSTTTKTNSSGQTSTFTTAPNGQITNRTPPTAPGSGTAHTDYNSDGSVAGTTDETGVRTTYGYDANGRVANVTRDATGAAPVRFDYTYDPSFPDKVVSVTPKNPTTNAFDPNWQGWKYDYFSGSGTLNHVYRLKNDGASTDTISTFQYDTKGRVTSQTTATNAVTDYAYSGADLYTVTHPSNNDLGTRPVTTYGNYDGVGRPRTITDPAGKDTTYTYDALGRVLTVTLPKPTPAFSGNFTTTYSYDDFDSGTGLVFTHITDPNGSLTKLGYDENGRLLKSIDAATNTTTYAYTRDVLTSITDANDNVTSYHYDPLKRLDKTTFPDREVRDVHVLGRRPPEDEDRPHGPDPHVRLRRVQAAEEEDVPEHGPDDHLHLRRPEADPGGRPLREPCRDAPVRLRRELPGPAEHPGDARDAHATRTRPTTASTR